MKNSLWLWQVVGITFVSILGTVLHFLYAFTEIKVFSVVSSVNESTWEHMKLMFFPMFIFSVAQYFFMKEKFDNFWCVKLKSTILGCFLIPTIFYTIHGMFGQLKSWVDIITFFVCVVISFAYEYKALNNNQNCKFKKLAFISFLLIGLLFIMFTFYPPKIPLFLDPLTLTYGLQ